MIANQKEIYESKAKQAQRVRIPRMLSTLQNDFSLAERNG